MLVLKHPDAKKQEVMIKKFLFFFLTHFPPILFSFIFYDWMPLNDRARIVLCQNVYDMTILRYIKETKVVG